MHFGVWKKLLYFVYDYFMERDDPVPDFYRASQLIQNNEGGQDSGVQTSQPSSDQLADILRRILDAPTSRIITYTSGPESR